MTVDIHVGDALSVLRDMPDESVHCCVTSPPYWGLRAYGGDPGMIGLEETFDEHLENLVAVFREVRRVLRKDGTLWLNYGDGFTASGRGAGSLNSKQRTNVGSHMPAKRGWTDLGLKPKDLMMMPARVAMALQADGWWLRDDIVWHKSNPMPESAKDRPTRAHEFIFLMTKADRYFYDGEAVKEPVSGTANARAAEHNTAEARRARALEGTKSISTRERRGMTIRKRATPPSHEGRECTSHRGLQDPKHDHRLMDRRTPKDLHDRSARLGRAPGWREKVPGVTPKSAEAGSGIRSNESFNGAMVDQPALRNLRDVWTFASTPFKGAHFATFPPALCEQPTKAGTSEHGVCPDCGASWIRLVGVPSPAVGMKSGNKELKYRGADANYPEQRSGGHHGTSIPYEPTRRDTTGFRPTCACYDDRYRAERPEPRRARKRPQRAAWGGRWKRVRARPGNPDCPVAPAVVLDPFGGAGTVGLVAERLGRDCILIEIKPLLRGDGAQAHRRGRAT